MLTLGHISAMGYRAKFARDAVVDLPADAAPELRAAAIFARDEAERIYRAAMVPAHMLYAAARR